MKPEDFSVAKFNSSMKADIEKQELNFCKAVIMSPQKISLTLTHNPQYFFTKDEVPEYAALNQNLDVVYKTDFSGYYYGVSPKIDSFSVIDAISGLCFKSEEGLNAYISKHCDEFMLHKDQGEYLLDVAKLILLTVASKYGIEFQTCEQLNFLTAKDSPYSAIVKHEDNATSFSLHGCPCLDLIERLQPYRFDQTDGVWHISAGGKTFEEIYKEKENIKLLVGKVFYSGVLLKGLAISKQKYNFENNGISNYELIYERSSFATVCAFDENFVDHPLLKNSRQNLEKFFRRDDTCKLHLSRKLSKASIDEDEILRSINEYMRCSYNVNQIGVSSNLKTPKNEVLFGLRASKNIDGGALYPSINGNAEVYDEDVEFYNNSVYEDLPTVYLDKKRSDLLGEIAREAYGELNMTSSKESWSCYGMIISGNLPKTIQSNTDRRRCHFNVLFENESDETLDEIKNRYQNASEAFENKNFVAIVTKYYKTWFHGLFGDFVTFLKQILKSKDFIESFLLLWISFTSIKTITFSLENISSLLAIVFACIILLTTVTTVTQRALKMIRYARSVKRLRIYGTMSYDTLCRKISKVMNKEYHPAAYASLKMHAENLVRRDLKKK